MIARIAEAALRRLSSQFPVVGITGPRQSGKTTLAKAVFPDKRYVTFDDRSMRALAVESPRDFLMAFPNGAVIDEAQKVPEIFDALKLHVDAHGTAPGSFILTGSSQFRLRTNMSDSLAGRAAFLKLLPFSTSELKNAGLLSDDPYGTIFSGQYPPLYDQEKRFVPEDWYESYIDTYLDLDVRDQINPGNLASFRRLIQVCASQSGQIISMDKIAREIGVSGPTVRSWLSVLEASFIIHFLEPDTNNLGKSVLKKPKLYFIDTGLLCRLLRIESPEELILSPMKGRVVETFAVSELLKQRMNRARKANLTYFRTARGDMEIDAVADWRHTFAIEVKSSSDPDTGASSMVRKYAAMRAQEDVKSAVFYLGNMSMDIGGTSYVSWKDWGDFLQQT